MSCTGVRGLNALDIACQLKSTHSQLNHATPRHATQAMGKGAGKGGDGAVGVRKDDTSTNVAMAELNHHCKEDDLWVSIDGAVYDITRYMKSGLHPGSTALPMQVAGRDASPLFHSTHSSVAAALLKSHPLVQRVGNLAEEDQSTFKCASPHAASRAAPASHV